MDECQIKLNKSNKIKESKLNYIKQNDNNVTINYSNINLKTEESRKSSLNLHSETIEKLQ
jgi:hypothetical protein